MSKPQFQTHFIDQLESQKQKDINTDIFYRLDLIEKKLTQKNGLWSNSLNDEKSNVKNIS